MFLAFASTQHHFLENPSYLQDCLGGDGAEGGFIFNKIKVGNYPQSEKTQTHHQWASCVYVGWSKAGLSKGELIGGLNALEGSSRIQKLQRARCLGMGNSRLERPLHGDREPWSAPLRQTQNPNPSQGPA